MADLTPSEIEVAELCFQYYAADDLLDGVRLGKWLYNLDLNPSLNRLETIGVSKTEGEKIFTFEEALPIYSEIKKEKNDQGCYHDFVELLKIYDKAENGRLYVDDLRHFLMTLGEKLVEGEVSEIFDDCLDDENDEGEVMYIPFLKRMCGLAPPLRRIKTN